MSSNQPPSGPPNQPPGPPPGQPPHQPGYQPPQQQGPGADQTVGPWGPPPEQAPNYGPPPGYRPPEVLDSGAGGPMPPPGYPTQNGSGGGRRKAILAGGTVVGVAALAGGAFAVYSVFFATGPQPAEALPASTLGYISVDLAPSGDQQIEALDTLNKFPAFKEQVDLGSDDDVREYVFDMAQSDGGLCPDVSWADDIEPWLGDRLGVAAVDLGQQDDDGNAEPTVVGVVQVEDADAAEDGLAKLRDCAAGPDVAAVSPEGTEGSDAPAEEPTSEAGGWVIEGEWAVVAETEDLAQQVVDAAEDEPLSDTDAYQKWTDAAGDPGIVNAYASPEAGTFLADAFASSISVTDGYACSEALPSPGDEPSDLPSDSDLGCEPPASGGMDQAAEQVKEMFADFDGAAMAVRFEDGGLEVETASNVDFGGLGSLYETDRGDDVVATLPSDTAIAFGLGFEEGWFGEITDYVATFSGGMVDIDDALAQIEAETGLALPEDAETLAGESAAFALSGETDFAAAASDPTAVLGGVKVKGDAAAIEGVAQKLLENPSVPPEFKESLNIQSGDDTVVAGFNEEYNSRLLEDGDLGDSDSYQDVVEESGDAAGVLFVDFDAADWLDRAVAESGDQQLIDNVKPLSALGWSVWADGDVAHSRLRVTFD